MAPGLFESSGIREVEQRLLGFLYAHAGRLQMLGTLDDMRRHLSQAKHMPMHFGTFDAHDCPMCLTTQEPA